jgi:hypothetical protein
MNNLECAVAILAIHQWDCWDECAYCDHGTAGAGGGAKAITAISPMITTPSRHRETTGPTPSMNLSGFLVIAFCFRQYSFHIRRSALPMHHAAHVLNSHNPPKTPNAMRNMRCIGLYPVVVGGCFAADRSVSRAQSDTVRLSFSAARRIAALSSSVTRIINIFSRAMQYDVCALSSNVNTK